MAGSAEEIEARQAPERRLLVINPNTNPAVTAAIRDAAEAAVYARTSVTVVNPASGPFSIETGEHRAAAVPRVISLVRDSLPDRYDAYVLGCFDDIGLFESRALAGVPVVGTCEAGIAAARTVARRFAIITTVHSAVPGIHDLLARYGAADICTVRAAGVGVAEAAGAGDAAEQRILAAMRDAIEMDGAEAILLGSGGLAGRAGALRRQVSVPIIDGVLAAVKMAEGLAAQSVGRS
jgi:allantoin racemase